jgi:hypothetical protein
MAPPQMESSMRDVSGIWTFKSEPLTILLHNDLRRNLHQGSYEAIIYDTSLIQSLFAARNISLLPTQRMVSGGTSFSGCLTESVTGYERGSCNRSTMSSPRSKTKLPSSPPETDICLPFPSVPSKVSKHHRQDSDHID